MDVVITDVTASGKETARAILTGVSSNITLAEVIRLRVRDEVARHNAIGTGLLDWEHQADSAVKSFKRNGFFVFVGDRQITDLDAELSLSEADVVSFFRLVPLAGG